MSDKAAGSSSDVLERRRVWLEDLDRRFTQDNRKKRRVELPEEHEPQRCEPPRKTPEMTPSSASSAGPNRSLTTEPRNDMTAELLMKCIVEDGGMTRSEGLLLYHQLAFWLCEKYGSIF